MKRWVICGLAGLLASLGIAACGGAGVATRPTTAVRSAAQGSDSTPSTPPASATPTVPGAAAPSAPAAPAAAGPSEVVQAYFADLKAGDEAGAYALLAPAWQAAHPYRSFLAGLPTPPASLLKAEIQSAANFNATVEATVRTASGASQMVAVHLVDLNSGPGVGSKPAWRLAAPPALR